MAMAIPTLYTERLTLRAITLDDVPAIQRRFDNWNIIQHLTNKVPWPQPSRWSNDVRDRGPGSSISGLKTNVGTVDISS